MKGTTIALLLLGAAVAGGAGFAAGWILHQRKMALGQPRPGTPMHAEYYPNDGGWWVTAP